MVTEGDKKRGSVPLHPPKLDSNSIPTKKVKQRVPKGKPNTTFRDKSKTKGEQSRDALRDQQ